MDIKLPKNPKHRGPEYEQDNIPPESHITLNPRHHVYHRRHCAQTGNDYGVDPFPIGVGVDFACGVEVSAIEAADGEGEDELGEAQDVVEDKEGEREGVGGAGEGGGFGVEGFECHGFALGQF